MTAIQCVIVSVDPVPHTYGVLAVNCEYQDSENIKRLIYIGTGEPDILTAMGVDPSNPAAAAGKAFTFSVGTGAALPETALAAQELKAAQ